MAKDNDKPKRQLLKMNSLFKDSSDQISTIIYGSSNQASDELERLNIDVDNIINSELNDTKNITSSEMSVFLVKLFNEFDRKNGDVKSLDDIFTADSSGLFQFFQEHVVFLIFHYDNHVNQYYKSYKYRKQNLLL